MPELRPEVVDEIERALIRHRAWTPWRPFLDEEERVGGELCKKCKGPATLVSYSTGLSGRINACAKCATHSTLKIMGRALLSSARNYKGEPSPRRDRMGFTESELINLANKTAIFKATRQNLEIKAKAGDVDAYIEFKRISRGSLPLLEAEFAKAGKWPPPGGKK